MFVLDYTEQEIALSVRYVSRLMKIPALALLKYIKRAFRYVKGAGHLFITNKLKRINFVPYVVYCTFYNGWLISRKSTDDMRSTYQWQQLAGALKNRS